MTMIDDLTKHLAGELQLALLAKAKLRQALENMINDCQLCAGRGSYVLPDPATGKDLWEDCASCREGRQVIEETNNA